LPKPASPKLGFRVGVGVSANRVSARRCYRNPKEIAADEIIVYSYAKMENGKLGNGVPVALLLIAL